MLIFLYRPIQLPHLFTIHMSQYQSFHISFHMEPTQTLSMRSHQKQKSTKLDHSQSRKKIKSPPRITKLTIPPQINSKTKTTFSQVSQTNGQKDIDDLENSFDSDFEYSEQIMKFNPRKLTRQQKEIPRVSVLNQLDWIIMTTKKLQMPQEVYYRAVLTFRRFLLMYPQSEQKYLTQRKIRILGLACISVNSKMEANFSFMSEIKNFSDGKSKIQKQELISHEIQLMKILQFRLPNKCFIIEVINNLCSKWNTFTQKYQRPELIKFDLFEDSESKNMKWDPPFFRIFLHVVDYSLVREISLVSLKEMERIHVEGSWYYEKVAEVLFNLLYFVEKRKDKIVNVTLLCALFKKFLTESLGDIDYMKSIARKSHLLQKKYERIFNAHSRFKEDQKRRKESQEKGIWSTSESIETHLSYSESQSPTMLTMSTMPTQQEIENEEKKCQFHCSIVGQNLRKRCLIQRQKYIPIVGKLSDSTMNSLFN